MDGMSRRVDKLASIGSKVMFSARHVHADVASVSLGKAYDNIGECQVAVVTERYIDGTPWALALPLLLLCCFCFLWSTNMASVFRKHRLAPERHSSNIKDQIAAS